MQKILFTEGDTILQRSPVLQSRSRPLRSLPRWLTIFSTFRASDEQRQALVGCYVPDTFLFHREALPRALEANSDSGSRSLI